MATLALNTLLTILDSIAKQVEVFETAVGTGSESGTVSKGAANNVSTLQAVADSQVQAELMPSLVSRAAFVKQDVLERALVGGPLQHAFDRHYGETAASLNQFLKANDARVHPALTRCGFQIDTENQFAPAPIDLATFAVSGPDEGVFASLTTVDAEGYGKARLAVRATVNIGVEDIVITLSLGKADGSNEEQIVTLPAGSMEDDEVLIGGASNRYLSVLEITITGGSASDAFAIQTTVERTIAL